MYVWKPALNSAARGLWIWGGLSLAVLWLNRARVDRKALPFAAVRFLCGPMPYLFLTYMPRIPGRPHYLAAAGAGLLIGMVFWAAIKRVRRVRLVAGIVAGLFRVHNWAYLWTVKQAQFQGRAEVLERIVRMVRQDPHTPVVLHCSGQVIYEVRLAVQYRLRLDG